MRLQEFLIEVTEENKDLWLVQHVAETDHLQVKEFPAIVILEDPFDFSEQGVYSQSGTAEQSCTVFIMLKQVGENDLTREKFTQVRDQLNALTTKFVNAAITAVRSANGIANIKFEKGTPDFMLIDAVTCDVMTLPVKGSVALDN